MDCSAIHYEIRTLKNRHCTSLTMIAEYPNDIVAIAMAHNFARDGEGVEVWRDDSIVYRLEPRTASNVWRFVGRKQSASRFSFKKWPQYLWSALHLSWETSHNPPESTVRAKARTGAA